MEAQLPIMTRKHPEKSDLFAYFGNGTIRRIGGVEKNIYTQMDVPNHSNMSDGEYNSAVATSKHVFGV
jgi:hypothetical protein